MKTAPCKICSSVYHTKSYHTVKPRKPMKQRGKIANKWVATRNQWFKENPGPYYFCHYCNAMMTKEETTLDHKLSRGRRPDLRNEITNLVACCYMDNQKKGSRSHDEYCLRCVI